MKLYSNIVRTLKPNNWPGRKNLSLRGLVILILGYAISFVGSIIYPENVWMKNAYLFGVGIAGLLMLFTMYGAIQNISR
jgi:hypothetical protein